MPSLTANFWPSARAFAEAVQCPAVCFDEPTLKAMLPAVDRLGMPLVTSGQFAYVFKLNAQQGGDALAVRCFRGFLGDREERYRALDAHLDAHRVPALPRFKYLPQGVLVAGRRFPVLVMEWVAGPTLDVYLDEVVGRREVVEHLAAEWLRLVESLRAAGVAHGDLQHGNVIVERGRLRLVDLDGAYVPALRGLHASEVGHQHYQHPARGADFFSPEVDNFSALVVYLSLLALAERPSLWAEHHDENLLFTRADFADPAASELFRKVRETGPEQARLADALAAAAAGHPAETPRLGELVGAGARPPAWVSAPAGVEVDGRTREVARAVAAAAGVEPAWGRGRQRRQPMNITSSTVQTIFGGRPPKAGAPVADPSDIGGNTLLFARLALLKSHPYVWGGFLHGLALAHVWAGFGVTNVLASVFCTLLFFAAGLMLYGLGRAFYEWDTGAPSGGAGLPAASALASLGTAAPQAATAAQGAAALHTATAATPAAAGSVVRRVVGNASLRLYHLPTCIWVDRIAARHRADFDSAASAHAAGYRPCRVCSP
jgi:Metal binding domain of Ada